MSEGSDDRRVTCAAHGTTVATFACVHLADANSSGLGACYAGEPEGAWPDLMCNACTQVEEWTDELTVEKVRVLCTCCWEDAFARNTQVRHADPAGWIHDALHRAERRQNEWTSRFGILEAARYRYGLGESPPWLGFGPSDGAWDVMCDPVVIGSWAHRSNTWLWGWANDWWQSEVTREVLRVKRAGERMGIESLWRSTLSGDEDVGWEVSSATLDLLPNFEGLYRAPTQSGSLFLAVRNTRRVT